MQPSAVSQSGSSSAVHEAADVHAMAAEENGDDKPKATRDPQMIQFIRDDWVTKQMRMRTHAFTETVNLKYCTARVVCPSTSMASRSAPSAFLFDSVLLFSKRYLRSD